jgi:hypothetical protein
MKIISVFEPIKKKKYFSPDHYVNRGSSFRLQPRERALLIFTSNSKRDNPSDQFKIKFSNRHFYLKYPCYKFIICIKNISEHRKLVCNTGCSLSKLLEHQYVSHRYSNISMKDLLQARRFQAEL